MKITKKTIATALGGLAIAGIVTATVLAFPQLTNAQTDAPAAATADATPSATAPNGRGERNGPAGDRISNDKYLAEALGITETELQTAQTEARAAEIQQAVKDGLITQAQADAMLNKTAGQRGGRIDLRGVNFDHNKYLAEALGITADELSAAQKEAAAAELAQAVTDGRLTQEQADLITARQALQQYIADNGLFESAVASAVKDGVITQAQADAILADTRAGSFGFGGMGDPGGRGGMHGMERGGRGGHGSFQDNSAPSDTQTQGAQS